MKGTILLERGAGPHRIARDRPSRYGVTGRIAISIPFSCLNQDLQDLQDAASVGPEHLRLPISL